MAKRVLKYGMIGGGTGSFIGAVHRRAIALDGEAVLVAGALSATPARALASAKELGLAVDRSYESWQAMLAAERELGAADRLDLIVVVTPNHQHFEPVKAALEAGFHVACDKPLVRTLAEAKELAAVAQRTGKVLGVTYNYSGYPLVRRAAELVRAGELGVLRKVFVEYHQGWLATPLEREGQKQAAWRTDPKLAGAGSLGDIGTHAEQLVSFVTGLEIESLAADVTTFVPGRKVDDDASVLLRFKGGARGVLTASQVCVGSENSLSIRVHGEKGSLAWRQETPNALEITTLDGTRRVITRGGEGSGSEPGTTRLPPGHPEGFHEAFANVYRGIFAAIRGDNGATYPSVHDGVRGVAFVEACLRSHSLNGAWTLLG